jgi:fructose-1-phosphate kinase PfkB-like protein
VLITLRTGCYALLRTGRGRAQMYRAWIPQVESVSSVGSGEAVLAGFVAAQEAELRPEECLRRALACGAANSQTVGAGVFDPRDVPRFAGMVEVQEIRPAGTRAAS